MSNVGAIEIRKLSKRYVSSAPYAIYGLDITVMPGEIYGFLGPNGAGKSTTIKMLLNFIQPTSGTATILGKDIVKESVEIRKSLGYLSGDFNGYEKMTGRQFLSYMTELQSLKHKNAATSLAKVFKVDLKKKMRDLSKGNRQKLGIIQACMHEPKVLILDEPTDGLDPLMQEVFYELLRKLQSRGTTIFLSSHNLAEVQKICDRVAIIRDGQLVTESSIADLLANASQTFEVTFKKDILLASLRQLPGVSHVKKIGPKSYRFQVKGNLGSALSFLAKSNVVHLSTKELNLEDEFLKFYEAKR